MKEIGKIKILTLHVSIKIRTLRHVNANVKATLTCMDKVQSYDPLVHYIVLGSKGSEVAKISRRLLEWKHSICI